MPQHSEIRHSPYSVAQLLTLVADIERYPEFLPWCCAARIHSDTAAEEGHLDHHPRHILAELMIRFKSLKESYISHVTITPPTAIHPAAIVDVVQTKGPFSTLTNRWELSPDLEKGGTQIAFFIQFEFASHFLQSLIDLFFAKVAKKMLHAFETRAEKLYGKRKH